MANEDYLEIYAAAIYGVFYKGAEIKFRIGENNQEIEELLNAEGAISFALITGYNPASIILPLELNQKNNENLAEIMDILGYSYLKGYGGSDDGSWEAEPSLFILDIPEAKAIKWAESFFQNAIVFGERGGEIRLIRCAI